MAYDISWWRTSFNNGEAEAIAKAIANENISQGPVVAEFEKRLAEYLDVPYVVTTTSGSMALFMSLWVAGVRQGDEVIIPNRTWIATAHAVLMLGAKVTLVDVEPGRPIIDVGLIEDAITEKTKAIIPVHMCGRAADMRKINAIADKYNLAVIEDAAQALGSKNHDGFLGTQSDLGCFSFSVAKVISTGQGGFIAAKNKTLYNNLVSIRTQGVGSVIDAHWEQPGFNFRFTDILAAIGMQQLKLLPERLEKLKAIYKLYAEGLQELDFIQLIPVNIDGGEAPVYMEALCAERDELINYMEGKGIQCRPFYPDLNYAEYLGNDGRFPESEPFGSQGMYLPCGPEQGLSNIQQVINVLTEFSTK